MHKSILFLDSKISKKVNATGNQIALKGVDVERVQYSMFSGEY